MAALRTLSCNHCFFHRCTNFPVCRVIFLIFSHFPAAVKSKLRRRLLETGLWQHRTIAATRFAGFFPPILRFEKLEIHTGFLRVSNLDPAKNLSPDLLAELCGVTLSIISAAANTPPARQRQLEQSETTYMNRALQYLITLAFLRRPHLFRLAGKDGGEKGRRVRLVHPATAFRQEPDMIERISHHLTLLNLTARRPSFRNQI